MKRIYAYVIEIKFHGSDNWCFYTGYKTLPTLKKKLAHLRSINCSNHEFRLVAKDYNRNIIKVYDL